MAGSTVNINLSVEDRAGTIKKRTSDAQLLNRELERAQKLAQGGGAQSGTRALAAQNIEYGRARGSMGATGASARDFANQAQGLGGLVQLYATYAANVFALGAAFRALSEAMNITNMIEGLNQLGAQGGNALGSLAKEFARTTGNALSMRESVEAVSKASSAGLSNKQILEVSTAATKASQVLGLSLPDAVNRLTRGIVKLEPELLDELGLFTKIGPAVEKYARELGRTESSLSDFERRQAFALAVLKEAEDKFGKIQIATNPYDKLLATLKDISITGLQLINTVLGPIVKFLSESPTALVVILGLLAKNLLGRVIPIVGQYNKALENSANAALERYTKISDIAVANDKKRIAGIAAAATFEKEKIEDIKNKELDALETVSRKRLDRRTRDILDRQKSEGIQAITAKDIAYLESKKPAIYGDIAQRLGQLKTLNQDILDIDKKSIELQKQKPGLFTAAGAAAARAETARRTAEGRLTVQDVSRTAQEVGLGAAAKKAVTDISEKRLGVIAGTLTGIGSAAVIATEGVSRLGAVFSRFLGWIGLAITAYQFLDLAFSKNDKEVAKLEESLNTLQESTKTAAATAKLFAEQLSVQSIVARANALDTLSTSVSNVVTDLQAADAAASWWNRQIDAFSSIIGQDLKTKFIKQFAPAIVESLGVISDPKIKAEAEQNFKDLLNISPKAVLNIETVAKALRDLDPEKVLKAGKDIRTALDSVNQASKQAAQPLQNLKEDLQTLDKSFQELTNTFIAQDPFTRYALNLNKVAGTMLKAFENATNQAAILNDIAKDPGLIRALPVQTQQLAQQTIKRLDELRQAIKAGEALQEIGRVTRLNTTSTNIKAQLEGQSLEAEGSKIIETARKQMAEVREAFKQGLIVAANQAVKIIQDGVALSTKQLTTDLQKTIAGLLPKTPETINILADLEKQGIEIRRQELVRLRELAISNDKLRITNELMLLNQEEAKLAPIAFESEAAARIQTIGRSRLDLQQQLRAYTAPESFASGKDQAGISIGESAISQGTLAILANTAQFQKDLAKLNNEVIQVELKRIVDQSQAIFDRQIETVNRTADSYRTQTAEILERLRIEGATPQAIEDARIRREEDQKLLERRQVELTYEREIAKATEIRNFIQKQSLGTSGETLNTYTKLAEAAQTEIFRQQELRDQKLRNLESTDGIASAEARRANEISKELRGLDRVQEIEIQRAQRIQQSYEVDIQRTQQALQDLEVRRDILKLADQEYANEKNALDIRLLRLEAEKRIDEIRTTAADKQRDLDRQIAALGGTDAERRQELENTKQAYISYYATQINGELETYNARIRNITAQQSLTERQKSYDKIFENSFNNMADAMINWMQTGKFAGKELFNSLIADLTRYELKLQMMETYGALRPGLLGIISSIFGGPAAAVTSIAARATPFGGSVLGGEFGGAAKGAYFDGIKAEFAKGGMFTNSIVTQPTLFKFARGTGLMGEAGPEAIVPLKRDSKGNLGVSSSPQKTEVVINNYTNQPAQARETMDARGNRKIEVIVGEMVAAELSRPTSTPQMAMRNTFNLQPALVRR